MQPSSRETNSPAYEIPPAPVNSGPTYPVMTPQPYVPVPAKRRRVWPWAAVAAVLVVVGWGVAIGAIVNSDEPAPAAAPAVEATVTVTGKVVLTLGQFVWNDEPSFCAGEGGYDDIVVGAPVAVTDSAGTVVALGKLSNPVPQRDPDNRQRALACRMSFEVTGVPAGLGFYGVEVSHRGVIRKQEAELTGIELGF